MRASGMDTVSSITMTPAEPAMVPAFRRPSTSSVTSISSARRMAADEAPAEVPGVVRLPHGGGEAPPGLDVLAADVDEAPGRADRACGDEHPLDEGVRVALEEVAVLERPRLALVGVDDKVDRPRVV